MKPNCLQIQQLRLTTAEAIKSKEDIELKCKHKITDMVTLMEKHKVRSSSSICFATWCGTACCQSKHLLHWEDFINCC